MSMRVSPVVTFAPAFLTVTVAVEADADNRSLQVVAESPDFYRSSQIPLDGQNAPRLSRFEFRNLPTGLYSVSGVLMGTHGPRAMTQRVAKVEPAAGLALTKPQPSTTRPQSYRLRTRMTQRSLHFSASLSDLCGQL